VNTGVEYLETTFLGTILSGDIQQLVLQELPRKLTAALFKRCGSYNKGTNVDTAQWSASTLWQEGVWSAFTRVIKKDGLDMVEQWQEHFCQPT